MDTIAIILGIAAVCFLLIYFAFKLDNTHYLLSILCIFCAMSLMLLIPKTMVDENDYCELSLNTTTLNATTNVTSYGYANVCVINSKQTASIFYQGFMWFWRIFAVYVFVYLVKEIFERYLKKAPPKK